MSGFLDLRRHLLLCGLALFLAFGPASASPRTDTPSGLPVPRFVSAKFDTMRGRTGPSVDYPIKFTYQKRGLPLLVTAETDRWRRVQDPDGAEVWVHARTLDGKRTVIVRGGPKFEAIVRAEPNMAASQRAILHEGVIAELEECKSGWCRIEVNGVKGWTLARGLWGASTGLKGP